MRLALVLAATLLASACDAPKPDPAPDTVPEPQATSPAQNTELRDAMQAPLDKAREVEDTQAEDEAERQRALEEAGG